MTLRELCRCVVAPIWITFEEDPQGKEPDLKFNIGIEPENILSDEILSMKVNLITVRDGAVFASVWEN